MRSPKCLEPPSGHARRSSTFGAKMVQPRKPIPVAPNWRPQTESQAVSKLLKASLLPIQCSLQSKGQSSFRQRECLTKVSAYSSQSCKHVGVAETSGVQLVSGAAGAASKSSPQDDHGFPKPPEFHWDLLVFLLLLHSVCTYSPDPFDVPIASTHGDYLCWGAYQLWLYILDRCLPWEPRRQTREQRWAEREKARNNEHEKVGFQQLRTNINSNDLWCLQEHVIWIWHGASHVLGDGWAPVGGLVQNEAKWQFPQDVAGQEFLVWKVHQLPSYPTYFVEIHSNPKRNPHHKSWMIVATEVCQKMLISQHLWTCQKHLWSFQKNYHSPGLGTVASAPHLQAAKELESKMGKRWQWVGGRWLTKEAAMVKSGCHGGCSVTSWRLAVAVRLGGNPSKQAALVRGGQLIRLEELFWKYSVEDWERFFRNAMVLKSWFNGQAMVAHFPDRNGHVFFAFGHPNLSQRRRKRKLRRSNWCTKSAWTKWWLADDGWFDHWFVRIGTGFSHLFPTEENMVHLKCWICRLVFFKSSF